MKAFPSLQKGSYKYLGVINGNPAYEETTPNLEHSGMDLRDYFAAKAMQGFCSEGTMFSTKEGEFQSDACAKAAYEWADAMMKARKK